MEKRVPRLRLLPRIILSALGLLLSLPASAQLVIGQYEDEAPLRTWNVFGIPTGPSLALGGTQYARPADVSGSLANPALLLTMPRFSATAACSYSSASLFKYSLVNTGVASSRGNLGVGIVGFDVGGVSFRWGGWAFAAAAGLLESYARPGVDIQVPDASYGLQFHQSGILRVFHLAVARRFSGRLTAGLGVNWVTGYLRRDTIEQYFESLGTVAWTDQITENYRGFFLNGGLACELSGRLTIALVGRTPMVKKAQAASSLTYHVPVELPDIVTNAEAVNEYRQPWVWGGGLAYRLRKAWTLVADVTYFEWSRYRVLYFDEPLERRFRDVLKAGAGVEYVLEGRLFNGEAGFPLRLGFSYDPQPMSTPHSSYYSITAGAGLRTKALSIDLSGSLGSEAGSGSSLMAGRVALSLTYFINASPSNARNP